jgi:hypothetical protein
MPPAEFERGISASERPQTLSLDRTAIGIVDINNQTETIYVLIYFVTN